MVGTRAHGGLGASGLKFEIKKASPFGEALDQATKGPFANPYFLAGFTISSSSTSKIKVELPGIPGRPWGP